jgi:hypothetical protein
MEKPPHTPHTKKLPHTYCKQRGQYCSVFVQHAGRGEGKHWLQQGGHGEIYIMPVGVLEF